MKKEKVYKILFIQLGEVYEIFAKNIYQSDMYASWKLKNLSLEVMTN